MVETFSKRDHENLKKMNKTHPRKNPMREHSEISRRSISFWLGKTRKVAIDEEENDKQKEPVKLAPRKKVCMEECKIKVTHKGKQVECGSLCDLDEPHTTCRCKAHRRPNTPKESKKEVKSFLRLKGWRRCVQDCNHKEREDEK